MNTCTKSFRSHTTICTTIPIMWLHTKKNLLRNWYTNFFFLTIGKRLIISMSENIYTHVTSNCFLKNHEKTKLEIPDLKKRKNWAEEKVDRSWRKLTRKRFFKKKVLCKSDLKEWVETNTGLDILSSIDPIFQTRNFTFVPNRVRKFKSRTRSTPIEK